MAKLQISDLTPELLDEMKSCESPKAVSEFLAEKDLEVSDKGAEMIYEELQNYGGELTDEQLNNIAGGCETSRKYNGTK